MFRWFPKPGWGSTLPPRTMDNATILLVEDDTLLRNAFKLLLEGAGYRIREAATAKDATASALSQPPDAIVLDLGLPDASGLEVARAVRANEAGKDLVIIALTGRVGAAEMAECLAAGCSAYLTKPVESKILIAKLRELVP